MEERAEQREACLRHLRLCPHKMNDALYKLIVYELGLDEHDAAVFIDEEPQTAPTRLLNRRFGGQFDHSEAEVVAMALTEVNRHRARLLTMQSLCDNWGWMSKNGITKHAVERVTPAEWGLLKTNPSIMLHHGVHLAALIPLLNGASMTARRYFFALSMVLEKKSVRLDILSTEFAQHGLEASNDYLEYDPSEGAATSSLLYEEREEPWAESFCEAKQRISKCTFADFQAFKRAQNGLVVEGEFLWLRRALDVARSTPALVAKMVWEGATPEEKAEWSKKPEAFEF